MYKNEPNVAVFLTKHGFILVKKSKNRKILGENYVEHPAMEQVYSLQ